MSKQELAECSEVNIAKINALKYHPRGHCHKGVDAFAKELRGLAVSEFFGDEQLM